jgi:hypothetical protein
MSNLIVFAGTNAAFAIQAAGASPLSYQWYFGSDKLDGYTNASISLTQIQTSMQGTYSVTVSNPYGVVTNSATLRVLTGTTLFIDHSRQAHCNDLTIFAKPGSQTRIDYADSLPAGTGWKPLTNFLMPSMSAQFNDDLGTNQSRFYRAVSQ